MCEIVLCPFSHTSIAIDPSLYVLVQDVSYPDLAGQPEEILPLAAVAMGTFLSRTEI